MANNSDITDKGQRRLRIWSSVVVFLFFFVFFTRIHPIVVFDIDDWTYIYSVRKAVPMPGTWNPARVLPEILMPFCAQISVTLFMPLVKDYILSMTLGFAITVSFFATVYFYTFTRFIQNRFGLSAFENLCILVVFFLFHFLVFRADNSGNDYMFCTTDATCYFYYIIPALLNCSLVLWVWTEDITQDFFVPDNIPKKALFVLASYLAILSNLYQSVIFAVFCAVLVLNSLLRKENSESGFSGFLKSNCVRILIVMLWFFSAILELTGGRSRNLQKNSPGLADEIKTTINFSAQSLTKFNKFFILLCGVLFIVFVLFMIIKNRAKCENEFKACMLYFPVSLCCAIIIYIFLILVCAKTGPDRIAHCDVLFGFMFFVFIIMLSVIIFCISKYKLTGILLPLLITVILFETFTQGRTFRESNQWDIDGKACIAVSQDIVQQIVEADEQGLSEIELTLLSGKKEGAFPHSVKFAWTIPEALYRHGIIRNEIEIVPVQSDDYNIRFGIPPKLG